MEINDTLKYYNENAKSYFENTKNGDMKKIYDRFLILLPKDAYILDFGCGSGRDSRYFIQNGYKVTAIDGSQKMCELAGDYIGQKVKCMTFDELSDVAKYDGIWACSSILHVEREKLPDILRKMMIALKEDGVIYTSFKSGTQCEIKEGKYYNNLTRELFDDVMKKACTNLEVVDYFENSTVSNVNRPPTVWGNYLIKKRIREK